MISFDLFDTLLTRDVFKPDDLFFFLGKLLYSKRVVSITPEEFKEKRILAELLARKNSDEEEVTLDYIYIWLGRLLSLDKEKLAFIKELELKLEFSSYLKIKENILKLPENNFLIISDTYLPETFISKILASQDIKPTEIFLSSFYLKTKHSDGLYDIVLNKYPLKKHIGDNLYSDVKMAKKKGIPAEYFYKSKPTKYEKEIYYDLNLPYELRCILSGAMKSTRLSFHFGNFHKDTISLIASNVAAPFLYMYVYWVLHEAVRRNINTLFFVSRDGQILYKIAKVILSVFKLPISIRYIFGSRKAWHLPAVTKIDSEVLDWIFDPTYFLSVEDICKRVDLAVDKVLPLLSAKYEPARNLSPDERRLIREDFKKSEKIHALILESAKKKRETVVKYLKQLAFCPSKSFGIVDVGWRARQQKSLSKILDSSGIYPEKGLYGFYLYLINPVKPYKQDEHLCFLRYKYILHRPAVIESLVAATHGTCIGYSLNKNRVLPKLKETRNKEMLKWGLSVQHKTIVKFAKIFSNSIRKYNVPIVKEEYIATKIIKKFLAFPDYHFAKVYGKIKVFEDQEESVPYNLCVKLSYSDIFKIFFSRKFGINHNLWREGSIVISFDKLISSIYLSSLELKRNIKVILKKIKRYV